MLERRTSARRTSTVRSSPTPNSAGRASTRDLRRHLHRAASDIVTTSDVTPSHRERLSTPTDVTAQQALSTFPSGPVPNSPQSLRNFLLRRLPLRVTS